VSAGDVHHPPRGAARLAGTLPAWLVLVGAARRACALVACLALAGPARARDEVPAAGALDPADVAFVELACEPASPVRGQRVELVVRFGLQRGFLADAAVALLQRRLDLPVQLLPPWREPVDGLVPVAGAPPSDGPAASVALHDGPGRVTALADRVVDGRPFAVYALRRAFRVDAAAPLELPPAVLRLAWATGRRTDLFGNVIATDRAEGTLASAPLVLAARALPVHGRPPGFTGAVGRFTLDVELSRRELAVGEPFALTLVVRGEGDLTGFAPPALDGLEHLHVLGVLDEAGPDARVLRYELLPTSPELLRIPAVPFTSWDPGPPGHWRTVIGEPLDVSVTGTPLDDDAHEGDGAAATTGADGPGASEAGAGAGAADPQVGAGDASPRGGGLAMRALVVALVAAAAAAGFLAGRGRRGAGDRPAGPRDRGGGGVVPEARGDAGPALAALERGEREAAEALLDGLAAWSRLPHPALVDRRLAERLGARGLDAGLADRAAQLVEAHVGARYGARPAPPAEDVGALLQALASPSRS